MSSIPLDISIFQAVHSATLCKGTPTDVFMLFISNNSIYLWFLIVFIAAILQGKKGWYPFWMCMAAFIVAWFISDEYLKPLFDIPRPFLAIQESCVYGFKPTSFSFPSGHMLTSCAVATMIYLFNRKNIFFVLLATFFALFVGYTRMYLGVHFPSDILGGAIFGIIISAALYYGTELARKEYKNE